MKFLSLFNLKFQGNNCGCIFLLWTVQFAILLESLTFWTCQYLSLSSWWNLPTTMASIQIYFMIQMHWVWLMASLILIFCIEIYVFYHIYLFTFELGKIKALSPNLALSQSRHLSVSYSWYKCIDGGWSCLSLLIFYEFNFMWFSYS